MHGVAEQIEQSYEHEKTRHESEKEREKEENEKNRKIYIRYKMQNLRAGADLGGFWMHIGAVY